MNTTHTFFKKKLSSLSNLKLTLCMAHCSKNKAFRLLHYLVRVYFAIMNSSLYVITQLCTIEINIMCQITEVIMILLIYKHPLLCIYSLLFITAAAIRK